MAYHVACLFLTFVSTTIRAATFLQVFNRATDAGMLQQILLGTLRVEIVIVILGFFASRLLVFKVAYNHCVSVIDVSGIRIRQGKELDDCRFTDLVSQGSELCPDYGHHYSKILADEQVKTDLSARGYTGFDRS